MINSTTSSKHKEINMTYLSDEEKRNRIISAISGEKILKNTPVKGMKCQIFKMFGKKK